jgi:hypothetical protein
MMKERTRNYILALTFLQQMVRVARTAEHWAAIRELQEKINAAYTGGGDVGALLQQLGAVPEGAVGTQYEKFWTGSRRPESDDDILREDFAPSRGLFYSDISVDELLRAIKHANGNGH